jgi:TRAP-type mannitol/chloroaromatic compound transport system substrate-binding protein
MRFQSTWPSKDIFHEYASTSPRRSTTWPAATLEDRGAASGAVVPGVPAARSRDKGTLDGGHGVLGYNYGKRTRRSRSGTRGPAFGMDPNMLLSWHNYGGGKGAARRALQSIGRQRRVVPVRPMPTQPLGWFKKPVAKRRGLEGHSSSAPSGWPWTSSPSRARR